MARAAHPLLAHRGVTLVEPALLPALAGGLWEDAGQVEGVRLVYAGGKAAGTRPFLLAPTLEPAAAVRALAVGGADALLFVGPCRSPTRALEPGDLFVVEGARTPRGDVAPHPSLAAKLANRAARRGLQPRRGRLASGVQAGAGDLAEDDRTGAFLAAARDAGVAAGALLVCSGSEGEGTEAPAAMLEGFEGAYAVLQEVLGSVRSTAAGFDEPPGPSS